MNVPLPSGDSPWSDPPLADAPPGERPGNDPRPEAGAGSEADSPEALLLAAFAQALSDVTPQRVFPPTLPAPPRGRTIVVGAGKAAAAMALAVEHPWPGELSGLVVAPLRLRAACARIQVLEAAHPVPDSWVWIPRGEPCLWSAVSVRTTSSSPCSPEAVAPFSRFPRG